MKKITATRGWALAHTPRKGGMMFKGFSIVRFLFENERFLCLTLFMCLVSIFIIQCAKNNPPAVENIQLIPNEGPEGTEVSIRISATDKDGDDLAVWAEAYPYGDITQQQLLDKVTCFSVPGISGAYEGTWIAQEHISTQTHTYIFFPMASDGQIEESGQGRPFTLTQ